MLFLSANGADAEPDCDTSPTCQADEHEPGCEVLLSAERWLANAIARAADRR